ncbi:hypothetical protein Sjap_010012 [Stephania japonica]|uniref:Uncharacterized protein n=1 Tax=Stephania japonica TaxID=461633 RepID=A0AAP0JAD5_9MAGN
METPSSTKRITRSQTKSAMNNSIPNSGKAENESETQPLSRQRNAKMEQRSVLIDITNDSPITGLAVGFLETPLSQAKKRVQPKKTPGSGEVLLRGQVKTLLHKVEEEAELVKLSAELVKLSAEHRAVVSFRDLARSSPSGLLAPTPNNTPNVPNLSHNIDVGGVNGVINVTPSDAEQETQQETMAFNEFEKNLITRSLLLDFSEKSEVTDSSSPCSSVLTSQGTEKSTEDDDASVWSIQVNASSIQDEGEDKDEDDEINNEDYYDEDVEEEDYEGCDGGDFLDELCEGLGKITVQEKKITAFAGKHVRFVYNSDDELEGEVVIKDRKSAVSPSVLRLKGMPTPVGKHIRFNDDEEE